MDGEDVILYFDLPSSSLPAWPGEDHVGCQHHLSKQNRPDNPPAFRFQFGSKKLLFLHGSRSEWVRTKAGAAEDRREGGKVKEVEESHPQSESSESEEEEDAWRILRRVIRRLERKSSEALAVARLPAGAQRSVAEAGVEPACEADVLSLLLTEGCYDHIVDQVLSLLDWNSLHSLLSVEATWREEVDLYWRSERLVSRLESHWKTFVPSQREVRWDREVSAMACDTRLLLVGFNGGGLVRYSRHDYRQDYFIIAHANSTVVRLGYNCRHLVTAGADRLVKVWSLARGDSVCQLYHPGSVQDLKVGHQRIVTASSNKSLYVHQVEGSALVTLLKLRGHSRLVSCLDYDGKWILSGSLDKTVRLWSDSSDRSRSVMSGHFTKVSDVMLCHPHGVSVSWDGTLRLWELTSQTCLRTVEHRLHLSHVSLSERWIVTADEDSSVFVFSRQETASPHLPQVIGVRSEERRRVGVRSLNTYSGDIVDIKVEDGALITLINTGDTKDTIEGRIVIQVTERII